MDAVVLSQKIKVEKAALFGNDVSVCGMDYYVASELKKLIDALIPAEYYIGYILLDGEGIVFRKDCDCLALVTVERNRIRWCLNKMKEIFGNEGG
ncbi:MULTISPECIES: hypothetical protein [unclassified Archaeoglobus]|uniref:hypothetical protein n=1 Tax=unclassified Archaeoglobus TaxID=2643606 RepID=UPI0025B8AF80|nr:MULTISPECIES: hypothetical protein [unclassified Archaeoglobus]